MTSKVSRELKGMVREIHGEHGWFNTKDHKVRGENRSVCQGPVHLYGNSRTSVAASVRLIVKEKETDDPSAISLCNQLFCSFIPQTLIVRLGCVTYYILGR